MTMPPRRILRTTLTGLLAWTCGVACAWGQVAEKMDAPGGGADPFELNRLVRSAITAPYLTPEEARALRVKHGVPTVDDLASVAVRARHALDRHAYTDAALGDGGAGVLDRAEALAALGKFAEAVELVKDNPSTRAAWLRVESYQWLGRADDAVREATGIAEKLKQKEFEDAASIVEAVRCAAMLTRLVPSEKCPLDHPALMEHLAAARKLDRFYWPAYLAEAQLLMEKDNYAQAREAAAQAASFNPASAEAVALFGELAVNAFDMDSARQIAARLDALASMKPIDELADADPDAPPASSLDAACLRARAALRQDDPEQAVRDLAAVEGAYAPSPRFREMRLGVAAASYDWPALDAALASFAADFPSSPRGEYRAGQTLSDLRQYDAAETHLTKAAHLAPHWPAPVIDLGLVCVQSGKDGVAREALSKATVMDPFNVRAANSAKLVAEVATYESIESEHFIIRARKGLDTLLAAEILPVMEENHKAVTGTEPGALAYEPPKKTIIEMMPDHQWFAVRIAGMPKIHTIAASTGPIIAMEAPREGKNHTGLYDWPRVLRHEYVHTVGLSRTGNRMPHWFTEAQAQYLERAPRDWNTVQLLLNAFEEDELFDFTQINIAFTRPKKATDRSLAYAQGQWMYEYMVERFGAKAPLDLMDLYAKGTREDAAMPAVFNVSRERFLADFKAWAKQQLISWGVLLPDGTPPIKDRIVSVAAGNDTPLTDEQFTKLRGERETPDLLLRLLNERLEQNAGLLDDHLIPIMTAYAKMCPVDPMPHKKLAQLALMNHNDGLAIEHLEWLDAREDHAPIYASQLAGLYAQGGEWEKAAAKAERAVRIAPYVASHRELAATIAVKRQQFPTARRHLAFLAALEPDRELHRHRLEALKRLESEGAR